MMIDIPQERGKIVNRWEDPTLCFFPLFDWLTPLPIDWMYVVYLIMFVAAFGIAAGCCYRASCVMLIITYLTIIYRGEYSPIINETEVNNCFSIISVVKYA